MRVEDVLSSRGRVKILKVLCSLGEANVTRIVRETGLNHKSVVNHLEKLVELGLVTKRIVGRCKMYSVNLSNPKVLALRDVIDMLEEA